MADTHEVYEERACYRVWLILREKQISFAFDEMLAEVKVHKVSKRVIAASLGQFLGKKFSPKETERILKDIAYLLERRARPIDPLLSRA